MEHPGSYLLAPLTLPDPITPVFLRECFVVLSAVSHLHGVRLACAGLLIGLAGTPLARAACPADPVARAGLAAEAAETAFATMDDPAFDAAVRNLEQALRCLDQPVPTDTAVTIHRAKALAAHIIERDDDRCRRCWAAVKTLDPEWQPSQSLMPPGLPLTILFDDAPSSPQAVPMSQSLPGGWEVDGQPASQLPIGRAFILVGFDIEGRVVDSGYYYRAADVQPASDPAAARRTASVRRWGTAAAGALAAGSGAAFLWSRAARQQLSDPSTAPVDLVTYQAAANGRLGTALGLGALSIGSAMAVWSVRW